MNAARPLGDSHDPAGRVVAALEAGGWDPRPTGPSRWESRCPSHDGTRRNLSVAIGDSGAVILKCHHEPGCTAPQVVEALGLAFSDLFPPPGRQPPRPAPRRRTRVYRSEADALAAVARRLEAGSGGRVGRPTSWRYKDADGAVAMLVCRFDVPGRGKTYRPLAKVEGGYADGDPPGPLPLYNLDKLASTPGRVWLVEGEKCADAAESLGLLATTTAHGAGSPHKSDLTPLAGRDVVIVPDNDAEGEGYAAKAAGLLAGLTPPAVVRIVRLPELTGKGDDLADWVDAMESAGALDAEQIRGELARLADRAQMVRARPAASRPAKTPGGDELLEFSNFEVEGSGRDERRRALSMFDLDASLRSVGGGWPKRVGDVLFVEGEGRKPRYLKTPASLFAWLDRRCRVSWTKGATFISQERFFEDRKAEAEGFESIECLPHFPPAAGVYYMHEPIPAGDGSKLERLLDFFAPETPHDRQLIKALILTLFWGGPPGARPAFIIQGPKDDGERMGVGVGKSKGSQILAEELVGGYVSLDQREPDIEALKTRLLSNESGRKRVGLVDNLKTHKFSCGGLEGLITDSNLSGRALYSGEGSRPNRMVWIFTVNGARVSKDIAERSIFVRLARPKYRPGWETEVRTFIRENRQAIMADVRLSLESPGDEAFASRDAPIRWADWCREVLSKVEYPSSVVTLAAARQAEHDADSEGRAALVDHFREQLAERGHDPDTCKVLIPNAYAYTWVEEATRRKRDMDSVVGYLEGLAVPELRKGKSGSTRGWIWTGPRSERTFAERLANSAWGK